jgi:hypothetical protein
MRKIEWYYFQYFDKCFHSVCLELQLNTAMTTVDRLSIYFSVLFLHHIFWVNNKITKYN